MRLVFDTNVMVAAVRSRNGASRRWLVSVLAGDHQILLSVPLVLEYEAVLVRPEQLAAHHLTADQIARLLDGICSVAVLVDPSFVWRPQLRDPDDEIVLETAVLGMADLLLTFKLRDFAGAERFGLRVDRPGPSWLVNHGARS